MGLTIDASITTPSGHRRHQRPQSGIAWPGLTVLSLRPRLDTVHEGARLNLQRDFFDGVLLAVLSVSRQKLSTLKALI